MMCYNCWRCDGDINDDNKTERKKRIHGSQAKRRKNTQSTQFDLKCAVMAFLALMITFFALHLNAWTFVATVFTSFSLRKSMQIDRQKAEKIKYYHSCWMAMVYWHMVKERRKNNNTLAFGWFDCIKSHLKTIFDLEPWN